MVFVRLARERPALIMKLYCQRFDALGSDIAAKTAQKKKDLQLKQYKKCLDAVREKKNKLKKLIETSKLLMNQEIENINKSLGI